jgi:hypothetical protein
MKKNKNQYPTLKYDDSRYRKNYREEVGSFFESDFASESIWGNPYDHTDRIARRFVK